MNTPARSRAFRSHLALTGLALVTAVGFTLPAFAATPDPAIPNVTIVDVKKGDDKLVQTPPPATKATNGNNNGGKGGKGSGSSSGPKTLAASKGDVTYIISLRNGSKFPAKGVTVEYHFYNRTTNTTNGLSTYDIQDITSTETVENIDPGKIMDVETQAISHANMQNLDSGSNNSGGGKGKGKVMSTPISSSSITAVLGWHIEVRYNDKLIQKRDYPDNLQDLLKKYDKR